MVSMLYKWLLLFPLLLNGHITAPSLKDHPIFVSVVEIEHNSKDKTLELSCKLFTDDFEKTLRKHYSGRIDLLDANAKATMGRFVSDYILKHLKLTVNDKPCTMQFLGFEQQEEGILSYFQVQQVATVQQLDVFSDLLYEFSNQQMGIIHCTVNGQRKSSKLNNPEAVVKFDW